MGPLRIPCFGPQEPRWVLRHCPTKSDWEKPPPLAPGLARPLHREVRLSQQYSLGVMLPAKSSLICTPHVLQALYLEFLAAICKQGDLLSNLPKGKLRLTGGRWLAWCFSRQILDGSL